MVLFEKPHSKLQTTFQKDVKIEEQVKVNLQLSQVCDDSRVTPKLKFRVGKIQSETDIDSGFPDSLPTPIY